MLDAVAELHESYSGYGSGSGWALKRFEYLGHTPVDRIEAQPMCDWTMRDYAQEYHVDVSLDSLKSRPRCTPPPLARNLG